MIISASRRTDIPAFYSEWFFNRLKEGFLYVRNPFNFKQIQKILLNPELIDCIVFWTKDPTKFIDKIKYLSDYNFYFQITINPYGKDIESNVISKADIIKSFCKLSDNIGSLKTIWRYDPILLSKDIDVNYHLKYFDMLSKLLSSYTEKCIISFFDNYKRSSINLKGTSLREPNDDEVFHLSYDFMNIAAKYHFKVETCAEKYDLSEYGINHSRCIDPVLIERIINKRIISQKDKYQRSECGCIGSTDIGTYNTCGHNCRYCYANYKKVDFISSRNYHDPNSPLLIGNIRPDDVIINRNQNSIIDSTLF